MDLKDMMDNHTLQECQEELQRQIKSINNHDDHMKRIMLLCMLEERVIAEIEKVDAKKFIDELNNSIKKQQEENNEKVAKLRLYLKENENIIKILSVNSKEMSERTNKIKDLLTQCDNELKAFVVNNDKSPVGQP